MKGPRNSYAGGWFLISGMYTPIANWLAAIPISMFFSNRIKGDTYARYQYFGALVVILGILVVLEPLVTQRHAEEFTCVAYNDEFCAACGEESTEEGCLSCLPLRKHCCF